MCMRPRRQICHFSSAGAGVGGELPLVDRTCGLSVSLFGDYREG